MKITVVSVGKLKEKYLKDGIAEYAKRLSRYCKLNFIEVADVKAPENLSVLDMEQVKNREGETLISKIGGDQFVITLEIDGESLTSEKFSEKIEGFGVTGRSDIVFIIFGGSLGLSDAVKRRANYKLSFSKMTFPHQLMKLFLVEQIYRAFRIIRNEPYHK